MADKKPEHDSDDILRRARKAFERAEDYERDNRDRAEDDIRFAMLEEQWPEDIAKLRKMENRPCLTINKLKAFVRQVVNDARQNKPQIKVGAVDDKADPETAKVFDGLIRNIEYMSNADTAYDTGAECSVSGGFGYWRVTREYSCEDVFQMDLYIRRVANQFSIYGDPDSMEADSSDWNSAFVIDRVPKDEYSRRYKDKTDANGDACDVSFDSDAWRAADNWIDDDSVILAEWWVREQVEKTLYLLSDGTVVDDLEAPDIAAQLDAGMLEVKTDRPAMSYKVTQYIVSGADVLEVNEWPGKYIPIIPVYGSEVVLEGKRYFQSLINPAKDAQRMFNYWRSTATEMVALAPKTPWIGKKGTFDSDAERWATSNTATHAYIEFDGEMPQRQPLDSGPAAGALQEALNAADDMKAIIGMYDASLGARSNETSGKAIMARQREGDVATFHFIDNLSRAIRHTGRVLIDLIPYVYSDARVIRVIGEDGTQGMEQINAPVPQMDENGQPATDEQGNPLMAMRDVTVGKYDIVVRAGPSFTTRREEAAMQMTELVRAFPQAAPYIADLMAKNFDWPGADEIAERFKAMMPGQQIPPEVQEQIEQGMEQIQSLTEENQKLKGEVVQAKTNTEVEAMKMQTEQMKAEVEREKLRVEQMRLQVEMYKAETERHAVLHPPPAQQPRSAVQ